MNLTDFVSKAETLGHIDRADFHFAFGVDKNFVPPMGIMLTSLVANNPGLNFHIHAFLNSIFDEDLEKLRAFVAGTPNIRLDMYRVDPNAFAHFHVDRGYTIAVYNRILIAQILYPTIERLVYIDADTLCVGDVSELSALDFDGNVLMAVLDSGDWLIEHKPNIGLTADECYYNSGFMYIDLRRWNELDLSSKMMTMLHERDLPMQDQDAINLLARHLTKPLPRRFNQFLLLKEEPTELPPDTIFIHFAGRVKPWQPWCDHPQRAIYDEYRARSLWREYEYRPRDYQENRLMGMAMRRQGRWAAAMKYYFRYVKQKISYKLSSRH
ncbi:MAG: glycosyltransferase family 8 protein [Selenomonadaceae bacterium]|nr:glycosyltransferase family 8 protein [Selenomonadaceae bacterium]